MSHIIKSKVHDLHPVKQGLKDTWQTKKRVTPHWKCYQLCILDWNICHYILATEDTVIAQESAFENFYWKILLQDVNWWSEVGLSKNITKIQLSHNHQLCV